MTPILPLALRSLANRWATAALTVLAIAVSVALLLGVEKVRTEAKASFASTISGTDLIVGARSGQTQLLLYSVFRIGNATSNTSWRSYQEIAGHPDVAWTIPLSLGDSHRGFRVFGTSGAYFEHYRFGRKQNLEFAAGGAFDNVFDAVLGAEVAEALGYCLGDPLIVAHGLGAEGFRTHEDKPFRVAGILGRTGTPVDRTVHVSLEGIEAMRPLSREPLRLGGGHPAARGKADHRQRHCPVTAPQRSDLSHSGLFVFWLPHVKERCMAPAAEHGITMRAPANRDGQPRFCFRQTTKL